MEAGASKDFRGKSVTKGHNQSAVPHLGEDSWLASINLSDDGKTVSLIDKTGKRRCVLILETEPVESGNYPAAQALTSSYCTICPNCKCLKIVIDGKIIYYDLQKKKRCGHTWCNH